MKNKKWLIFIIFIALGVVSIYMFKNLDTATLKSDVFTSEYGEEINFKNDEILDTPDTKILDSLTIDLSEINLEENKEYPKVGKHRISLTYKEFFRTRSEEFILVVSDTKKPKFIEAPKSIVVKATNKKTDFKSYFKVEDLSDFQLKIDTSLVDFEEEGTYDAKAVASDVYGNEASYHFYVVVEKEIINRLNQEKQEEEKQEVEKQEESEEKLKVESAEEATPDESEEVSETDQSDKKDEEPTESQNTSEVVPTTKNGILIVNKKHALPTNYSPGENPTAVAQLQRLISEMQRFGYNISDSYSGFRTYDYQKNLYERYMSNEGKEAADTYSARPGHSEHQTGLAFDLKHADGPLVEQAAEAKWIAENASDYGFIVRYQAEKEEITGYQYEPWHLRYIGEEATDIYNSGLALEEYLGVEGGDYNTD